MLLETLSMDFRKARTVNQTSNGFVSKVPINAEPVGDAGTATGSAIIELAKDAAVAQNGIVLLPYATGGEDVTFSVRIIGWRRIGRIVASQVWIPINLIELSCTCGASAGVANGLVLTTEFFADTITVTTGSTLSGEAAAENIVSPANDTIAHALVDLKGCEKLELSFTTGGSATDCNALLALL